MTYRAKNPAGLLPGWTENVRNEPAGASGEIGACRSADFSPQQRPNVQTSCDMLQAILSSTVAAD
ncbi:MAG: hypothetical protein ACREIC_05755, partial [Limisphaerales bacterium]